MPQIPSRFEPSKSATLLQIENDTGELIPGQWLRVISYQRKILRLVVGSDFSWVFREKLKTSMDFCGNFLRLFPAPCDAAVAAKSAATVFLHSLRLVGSD